MKNWFAVVLLLCAPIASACDICGSYLSLYPEDRSSFVSMLYKHRVLSGTLDPQVSLLKHGGSEEQVQYGDYLELYSTMEFRANYFLSESVSILAIVPMVNRYRSIDRRRMADTYGVGDPVVMGNFIVANTSGSESFTGFRHRLTFGLGVKIPLGRTDVQYNGELLDRDMQAGSGTWDGLTAVTYSVRKSKLGVGVQWMGGFTTENQYGDRYGYNHNLSVEPFYLVNLGETTVAPFVGGYMETFSDEVERGEVVDGTGGTVLFSKTGARVWRGKWNAQAELQVAMAEERAETVPPNRFRIVAGVSYFL